LGRWITKIALNWNIKLYWIEFSKFEWICNIQYERYGINQ
jgi:hypothetical protein